MRTLHVGLRVADLERSVAFYTCIGYEVLGEVPATELGNLTMLKLPGDEFVTVELVHDPKIGRVELGGLSHLVIHVEDVHLMVARPGRTRDTDRSAHIAQRLRGLLDRMGR